MHFEFTAPLWEWEARAAWFFVTLPEAAADDIAGIPSAARGFGSARVRVTVGGTTWTTSVFPLATMGSYVLPVKKAVRSAEAIAKGDDVKVLLELLDA